MVWCPICKNRDYRYESWFIKHMTAEHNWSTSKAVKHWITPVCPSCGREIINPVICSNCGYVLDERLRELEKK